jgi:Ni,Fe-hydrogenase I large subunit
MNPQRTGIEGSLLIRIVPARGQVSIESSRPLLASRLFEGKAVDEALNLIPLLFNVCGQAQQTAAVRAIETALDRSASASVEQARDALVDIETLREHLWRILMDWPRFSGDGPASAALPAIMGTIEAIRRSIDPDRTLCTITAAEQPAGTVSADARYAHLRALVRDEILDADPDDWLNQDADALQHWLSTADGIATRLLRDVRGRGWQDLGESSTGFLQPLPASELIQRLDGDQAESFIAAPTWHEQLFETGPLARQSQHPLIVAAQAFAANGLLVRLLARLIEVATIVGRNSIAGVTRGAAEPAPGLAQVEAARGRLCHRVVLDGERVSRYRILAPTEWNFGPDGAAAQALQSIRATDAAAIRAQADLLVHAIDPCVGYNLLVESN